jgi:hypothetical protein
MSLSILSKKSTHTAKKKRGLLKGDKIPLVFSDFESKKYPPSFKVWRSQVKSEQERILKPQNKPQARPHRGFKQHKPSRVRVSVRNVVLRISNK